MKKFLYLIFSLIINIQCAIATEPAFGGDLDASLKSPSSSGSGVGAVIFALLFVICLIYITGIIYTRLNTFGTKTVKKQLKNCKADNILVLSTIQLGQGKNLHVVETNGKKVLVGSTANSINVIKDLGEDEDFVPKEDNMIDSETETVDILSNEETEVLSEDFELYKKYL